MEKAVCRFLLILVILYYSQGVLIPFGTSAGPIILILLFTISLFYFIKLITGNIILPKFVKLWSLFLILNTVYFLLTADVLTEFNFYKEVLLNFLPFFAFYYFSVRGVLTRKDLIIVFLFLLPIFIFRFRESYSTLQWEKSREDVVDNTIYYFLGLLPFALLIRKQLFSFSFLMVIWFFTVQSNKRAAILCGGAAILIFIYRSIYLSDGRFKVKRYFTGLISFIAVTYLAYYFYSNNQYLVSRMELMLEGSSSGRDAIADRLWNGWYNSNDIMNYLFGFGYNSTMDLTQYVSHNDWLDMLVSFGLIGLIVYFLLFRRLVLETFNKNWSRNKKIVLAMIVFVAVITSLTSRWYWGAFAFMNFLLLPYLIATKEEDI